MTTTSSDGSFVRGRIYTRHEIHDVLGGSTWAFLPMRAGRVLCGCFRLDLNPEAPHVVLPDPGDGRAAAVRALLRHRPEIPVFLKRTTNQWEYAGRWRPTGYSTDPETIRRHAAHRPRAVGVLTFEQVRSTRGSLA